jgi:predicted RNase H-like HicB family nuclease
MNYGILFERIEDADFPPGHYYAHIPSLGLSTHGLGVEGARAAARDLAQLWIAEKRASHEAVPAPGEIFFSTLELPGDALQGA